MKANRHDHGDIFSVCVLYAAHGIFITIKDVYKQCGVIKHRKSACLPIIETKSNIDHNRKLLQALDDGLKWVLSSAVKRLIASKIKVFVYIIYVCVLCIYKDTHIQHIL